MSEGQRGEVCTQFQIMSQENGTVKKKVITRKQLTDTLKIYRFVLPYKWHFIVGMICLVVSTGVVSFIPGGFGKLIDTAVPSKDHIEKTYQILHSKVSDQQKLVQIDNQLSAFPEQKEAIEKTAEILHSNLPTDEKLKQIDAEVTAHRQTMDPKKLKEIGFF